MINTAIGTFAGMAVYDMITDENGNTVKAAPYYMSGSERVTVSGEISKVAPKPESEESTVGLMILLVMFGWTVLLLFYMIGKTIFRS